MKAFAQKLALRLGYRVQGVRMTARQLIEPSLKISLDDAVCRLMFERSQGLSFVQIGAFDGVSFDPIHKYIGPCGWTGVMIEPQPRGAASLRNLYSDNPGIRIVEAAIADAPGERTLYVIEDTSLPDWLAGSASFDRRHLTKWEAQAPGVTAAIKERTIACTTMADALSGLDRVDLLQIDTEGADGWMLSMFPFDRFKPEIIHFEIAHLSKDEREQVLGRLEGLGYEVAPSGGMDLLAVLKR